MANQHTMQDAKEYILNHSIPITESGCWIWEGAIIPRGYGLFRKTTAHRVAYKVFIGHVPNELMVCHKCDIRLCVNPHHLFLGTGSDNTIDSVKKGRHYESKRTHCQNGHEYIPENILKFTEKRKWRRCRICHNKNYDKRFINSDGT